MIRPWKLLWIAGASAGLVFIACGGGGGNPGGGRPVASTPLAGNIDGRPFTPVAALAVSSSFLDGGVRWLRVYEQAADCFTPDPQLLVGNRYILTQVPYLTGVSYDLGFGNGGRTVTFVVNRPDAGYDNLVAFNGRIEVVAAPPDAGAVGTIRLRASADNKSSVEGQLSVTACDGF